MEKNQKARTSGLKKATILSGIGMGLLLGLIMGLSVSEVVKVIMGALTALLGAFLGFDRRPAAGESKADAQKEDQTAMLTSLRAGWFGIAVVAGILSGMVIRTQELFTQSVAGSVKQWTDAGYSTETARAYVAFQRLGINPKSGETGPITEVQRAHSSNLFSSEEAENICAASDPDQWNHDWARAKQSLLLHKNEALNVFIQALETNVAEDKRFDFLPGLYQLFCSYSKPATRLCGQGVNMEVWQKEAATATITTELLKLPEANRQKVAEALAGLICDLETENKK